MIIMFVFFSVVCRGGLMTTSHGLDATVPRGLYTLYAASFVTY